MMEIPQFTPRETQLAAEKRLKFQGTTKVDLHQIHFDPHSHWQLDQRNVDCLWMIFQEEQCQNLTLKHHIPAMSPDHIWSQLSEQPMSVHVHCSLTQNQKCPIFHSLQGNYRDFTVNTRLQLGWRCYHQHFIGGPSTSTQMVITTPRSMEV